MSARSFTQALFFGLLVLAWPALGQEVELLQGQAGLYPLRATLSKPAAVGPAHLIVELGKPKELFQLPPSRHTPAPGEETPAPPPRELAVSVVMEMPDMLSTKPTSVKLTPTAPSRFEGDVLITMRGDWRMQFVVQTPEGEFRPLAKFKVGPGDPATSSTDGGLELCDPSQGETIPLKIRSFPDPARVGQNRVRIELPESVTMPVMVGVDMPGLALGLPPREAIRQDDGSYEAFVDLPMAGYWQLRVDLNGRALPPFALTVEESPTRGPSRALLPVVIVGLIPVLLFVGLRKRSVLKPVALGATLLLTTLAVGAAIESLWPSRHSMEMDMLAFDMGLGHLAAPLPVLEARLEKVPFVTTKDYPATVVAAKETLVVSGLAGVLSDMAPVGAIVGAGEMVARVGSEAVRAPSRGVVVRAVMPNGSTVGSGSALLSLSDPRTVAVRARIPLTERDMLQAGLPVNVVGGDGRAAKGKLTLVSAVSDGRGFEIEAVVDNARPRGPAHRELEVKASSPRVDLGTFAIGQNVVLKVGIEGPRSTITIPREAVRETADGEPRVFLVTQVAGHRVARAQKVTLGESNETHVQVLGGLTEGQVIVTKLEPSLRDGDVVVRATLGEGVYRSLVVPGEDSH